MSWLFSSGGQSIGASASASVLATEIAVTTTSVAGYGFFSCSISPSVVPFSSHLQLFPTSGSFPMSQFLASGGQSIGVSALASILAKNIQE